MAMAKAMDDSALYTLGLTDPVGRAQVSAAIHGEYGTEARPEVRMDNPTSQTAPTPFPTPVRRVIIPRPSVDRWTLGGLDKWA